MRATHTPPSHSLRHNEHGAFSREACQAASCSRSASLQPLLASSVRHPTLLVPHQQRPGLLLRRVVTLCWSRRRRFRRYWLHARPQPLGHCNSDTRELRPLGEQHEPVATSRGLDSRACTAQDSIRLYQRPEEPLCRRLVSPYAGARGDAFGTGCMPGQSHSAIATTTHESRTSIITLAAWHHASNTTYIQLHND